ncbi:MICAL-like protein 1 [Anopheles ziemanni]|uniref:MICAL-like protein 1 n=1 Tax=Anopheles ziemanni TaxID=345580 RepID=UPI00265DA645|nr:MICAL-like protein 1 [Anopheles ziemanni]
MSERRGTKALELWCRRVAEGYKDVKITNMSTSWRDGLAFCAIIHNFRPDLIDFASLSKDNVYYNNELAFTIAEQHLGIPSLLDPADMVKYEVPDRFSILTYLSQYYRVFSNQEPAANKKASEKDAKPDDLNPKIMASIPAFVGVPKRATCNRCSNPIFLAERISFGEKSYHRSCLKCARCGTQLTVGSFYETETDGEYCCETCPDEELQLAKRRESSASSESSTHSSIGGGADPGGVPVVSTGLPRTVVRSSKLLDRISFFESAPLSDEEKTSNLERKSRMSSFLKQTLGNDEQEEQDKPPDLPVLPPPKQNSVDKQPITSAASTEPEDPTVDVEDEFEKLVQGLDDTAGREDISEKSISNELGLENIKDHPSEEIQPSESIEESLTEATNVVLVPADIRKQSETSVELPETEKLKDSSLESDETLDDTINTNTVIQPTTEISLETVKDDRKCTEAIIEEEKQSSPTPPVLDSVPASVTESIVPEGKESTDPNLLPSHESVTSTEPKDSTNEPITSETQVLPDDSVLNTNLKQVPEELETSNKLKLESVEEPVESSKPAESEVPKDEKSVKPAVVIEPKKQTDEDNDDNEKRPVIQSPTADEEQYPSDLNPFGNDDEEDDAPSGKLTGVQNTTPSKPVPTARHISTNPFGSDDDDDDTPQSPSSKPPRPPPPKVKTTASSAVPANPFGEEDDDEQEEPAIVPVVSKPSPRRTPVPTPRKAHAYNDSVSSLDNSLMSSSRLSSSNVSLASSLESGPSSMVVPRRKKGKAPDVPVPPSGGASSPKPALVVVPSGADKTSTENLSNTSGSGTLTTPRKKRLAPAPPPSSSSTPKQSSPGSLGVSATSASGGLTRVPSQRLLTLDASLMADEHDPSDPVSRAPSNESVVYRRTIVPLVLDEDASSESPVHNAATSSERQWEKMKDNKEAQNRNRQSQSSPISEGSSGGANGSFGSLSILANKSSQGKWKRRKGPAPALPMLIAAPLPERKPIKMLPLKEIHQELQIIETQQQGLEKQGIVLEKMIRERCEGVEADVDLDIRLQTNSKEVEDLIMQLFELVNEKNELFRRQAELMYLRRMHRLEQEQADLEYEIRLLMAQPERNKTDSDKEKEEALIARLVEIVQLRNEVVECLEMDRIREAEEDLSIKQSIEERAASQQSKHGSSKKESSANTSATLPLTDAEKRDSSTKLSKKEKKKLKEAKKLSKSKKIDSEKDADETESSAIKEKKKKRKFLF